MVCVFSVAELSGIRSADAALQSRISGILLAASAKCRAAFNDWIAHHLWPPAPLNGDLVGFRLHLFNALKRERHGNRDAG